MLWILERVGASFPVSRGARNLTWEPGLTIFTSPPHLFLILDDSSSSSSSSRSTCAYYRVSSTVLVGDSTLERNRAKGTADKGGLDLLVFSF